MFISCWQLIHYWVFAFKVNFSRTPISKAPFELDLTSTPVESSIPEAVLHRVSGKQAPPAPHKQRLLVAAAKEAKAEAKGKADPKEAKKPKAKAKGKAKCKAKSKKEAKPETSPDTPGSTMLLQSRPSQKRRPPICWQGKVRGQVSRQICWFKMSSTNTSLFSIAFSSS